MHLGRNLLLVASANGWSLALGGGGTKSHVRLWDPALWGGRGASVTKPCGAINASSPWSCGRCVLRAGWS